MKMWKGKTSADVEPPQLLQSLLERGLSPEYRDAIVGDLHEEYVSRFVPLSGRSRANVRYLWEVLLAVSACAAIALCTRATGGRQEEDAVHESRADRSPGSLKTDAFGQNASLALSLGVCGGAALVLSHAFFTPGKYVLLPYAALVLAIAVVVRAERMESYARRFAVGLGAFVIASLAHYAAVALSPMTSSLSVGGHASRLSLLLAIGVAVNLPVARLSSPRIIGTARADSV